MTDSSQAAYLGVDTGGTFTDFFLMQEEGYRTHKVLSTPASPDQAIIRGIQEMGLMPLVEAGRVVIVHGSTVATNAALEKKGVSTVFVTNTGFGDMLTLGRQNREGIYDLQPATLEPPVPSALCLELEVRRDSRGEVVTALSEEAIQACVAQIEALKPKSVAINLLFSYLNNEDEQRLAEAIPSGFFVSLSSEVLPEYKEYERGMATWLNAWLGPKVESYIQRLQSAVAPCPLGVMQSSGGTIDAHQASKRAVNLLLSGPAGGLAAADAIGKKLGRRKLMTFDMGGTSTDVALLDGGIRLTSAGKLGPYPVAVPMVDMHTIGAGGGSIAYLDAGGLLHVGPESAGASPGPACYGQGGERPTVTDANVVLGRIRPEQSLGGSMHLDASAAQKAVGVLAEAMGCDVEAAARGIISLANEHMAAALRVTSVQQGYDPGDFVLCCFGGAGGLHVCALAEELGMSRVLIPANGGVLSAFGMLVAPPQRQLSRTINKVLGDLSEAELLHELCALESQGVEALRAEGVDGELVCRASLDLCYQGQSFTLNIAYEGELALTEGLFHEAHRESYGYHLDLPIQVINARVSVEAEAPIQGFSHSESKKEVMQALTEVELPGVGTAQMLARSALRVGDEVVGPAIINEAVATTYIESGWLLTVDEYANLSLQKAP